MQHPNHLSDFLMQDTNMKDLVMRPMPVSGEWAAALQRLRCSNNSCRQMGASVFMEPKWVEYRNGVDFVARLKTDIVADVDGLWTGVLQALDRYIDIEDVISKILLVIQTHMGNANINNYYTVLSEEASLAHIRIVGGVVTTYPRNLLVQHIGFLVLSKMYQYASDQTPVREDMGYKRYVSAAITALSLPNRTANTVFACMQMLRQIDVIHDTALAELESENGTDIMSAIFDAQHNFSRNMNVLRDCDFLSVQLLPKWTAPVRVETQESPSALHIIMACMDENPASRFHQEVACRQLSLLVLNNTSTLVITHDTMTLVANVIRPYQQSIFVSTDKTQEHDAWTFLHAILGRTETIQDQDEVLSLFQRSFSMDFLLRSLVTHTCRRNEFRNSYERTIGQTALRICRMVLLMLEHTTDGMARDRFFKANGISIIMNVVYNHCNQGRMTALGPALAVCMDILLHALAPNNCNTENELTVSTRKHKKIMKRFAYAFTDDTSPTDNLPSFIRSTLLIAIEANNDGPTIERLRVYEQMLMVLLLLSGRDRLFFEDCSLDMASLLSKIIEVFGVYSHAIAALDAQGRDTRQYTVCLRNMVHSVDLMDSNVALLNNYSFVQIHDSNAQTTYLQATRAYRTPLLNSATYMELA